MHPIAFQLGDLAVRWYGVMAAIGFLAATGLVCWNRRIAKMSSDQATGVVMTAMIAGVIGARIFYVIQFFPSFRNDWLGMIRIDRGGLVFYGGFFLALIAIWGYCRLQRLELLRVFDIMTPALAIGHAAGRIGCFLNGCCYGKPTELAWGVLYPAGSAPAQQYPGQTLHPVQLYEAGLNILMFGALVCLVRRGKRGMATAGDLTLYGLMRFGDEFFRGDHRQFWNGFTPAQVIGLVLVPVGIGFLIYFWRHEKQSA